MARIKGAQNRKVRRKKLFKRSKGFFLSRSNRIRQANQAVMKADANAFVGRKQRKRHFRSLWIVRINAALKPHGMRYNQFIHGLKVAGIDLNRKVLADLAMHDAAAFEQVVDQAKAAIA